jgi:hypothetical protein
MIINNRNFVFRQMQAQDLDDRFNFVKDRENKIKQIEVINYLIIILLLHKQL